MRFVHATRLFAAAAALILAACNGGDPLPDGAPAVVVELPGSAVFPEGVAAAADGTLFVGSLVDGTIYMARDGADRAQVFADAGAGAVGLLVDDVRGLLWACRSNPFEGTPPALLAFDLADGMLRATHPFPDGTGLCNDIAIGPDGHVYATDSLAHRVVRVEADAVGRDGSARTWLTDPAFVVPEGTFGLNGLVFDGRRLHIVTYETGALFAIDVDAAGEPGAVQTLELGRALSYADGLKREAAGRLLVVEGGSGQLTRIDLASQTVEPVLTELDSPTTVALTGEWAWLPVSQFDHLFGADPAPHDETFVLVAHRLGE